MKKLLALILCILFCTALLAACGESTDASDAVLITEGVVDCGGFTVTLTGDWNALPSGSENLALLGKGAVESDYGDNTKAWIGVECSLSEPFDFSNINEGIESSDLGDITIGSFTYHVYTLLLDSLKGYILVSQNTDAGAYFRISMQYDSEYNTLSIDDAEIRELLGSITVKQ